MSKQTKLKDPQQISFIGKLSRRSGAKMFFIIEKNQKKNNIEKLESRKSKIKQLKIRKRPRITYSFGCKDYMQNFRPEKVKMRNKVLREKSHCVVC